MGRSGERWTEHSQHLQNDARNIRFSLSTDPFGEQSSGHSTWPVTLCIYNLPPWLCMKRKFIMMPVLIPGPKQPSNDIDVYLKPLIEDLLLLWKDEGVRMWDAHAEDHFNLRALHPLFRRNRHHVPQAL